MGGRLDATNVLDLGVATITNVQRDHERFLGSTLTAIGGEKAPIIKAGDLAVTARGRGLRPIRPMRGARRRAAPGGSEPGVPRLAPLDRLGRHRRRRRAARPPACRSSRSGCSAATRRRMRPSPSRPSTHSSSAGGSSSTRWRFVAPRHRSMARPPRALGRIASRRRPGPPRRGAQPCRCGGAGHVARRPWVAEADDRLRRDARSASPPSSARWLGLSPDSSSPGRRSRRPPSREPGPDVAPRLRPAGRNGSHGSAGTQNRRRRSACGRRLALSRRRCAA